MPSKQTQLQNSLAVLNRPLPHRAISLTDWEQVGTHSSAALVKAAEAAEKPWQRRALAAAAIDAVEPTSAIPVERSGNSESNAPQRASVISELDETLRKLDTVPRMLVAALVNKITIDDGEKVAQFDRTSFQISVRTLSSRERVFAPIAHEIGHALHTVGGAWLVAPEEVDNRERPRDAWERGEVEAWPSRPSTWRLLCHEAFNRSWVSYRNNTVGEVTSYQQRNVEELFACAFEAWVSNPTVLRKEQPVFDCFFDMWCGRDTLRGVDTTEKLQQVSEESGI